MAHIASIEVSGFRSILQSEPITLSRINVLSGGYPQANRDLLEALELCTQFFAEDDSWTLPDPDVLHPQAQRATVQINVADPDAFMRLKLKRFHHEDHLHIGYSHILDRHTTDAISDWRIHRFHPARHLAEPPTPELQQLIDNCQQPYLDPQTGRHETPDFPQDQEMRLAHTFDTLHQARARARSLVIVEMPDHDITTPATADTLTAAVHRAAETAQVIVSTNSSLIFKNLSDQNVIMGTRHGADALFEIFDGQDSRHPF